MRRHVIFLIKKTNSQPNGCFLQRYIKLVFGNVFLKELFNLKYTKMIYIFFIFLYKSIQNTCKNTLFYFLNKK